MNNIEQRAERRKARRRYKLQQNNKNGLPRLSVFRSNKNISVQIIDDNTGNTLVSCSSLEKTFTNIKGYNVEGAHSVGTELGKRALEKKISKVIFDIGSYKYHGRVRAVIESVLKVGINDRGENQ